MAHQRADRAVESANGPIGLGLCLAAFAPVGLTAALEVANRAGVGVVDLPADSTFRLVDFDRLDDPEHHRELAAVLSTARVSVGCVSNSRDTQLVLGPHGPHTDPVLVGSPDEKRAHGLRAALGTVRLAAGLGAPLARVMLGVPDVARWLSWWGSQVSWQDNIDAWVQAAEPVLKLAADLGVQVVVEPHPKQVVYDVASAHALLASVHDVRLCIDPANLAAVGHDPTNAVRGWGQNLAAVHAKDLQVWRQPEQPRGGGWSRYGPGPAFRFRAVGSGELPWPAIVPALQDEDYRGVIYVEHEDALMPSQQGITTSLAALRQLLPSADPQGRTW